MRIIYARCSKLIADCLQIVNYLCPVISDILFNLLISKKRAAEISDLLALQAVMNGQQKHGHSGQRVTATTLAGAALAAAIVGIPLVAWLGKSNSDKAAAIALGNQRDIDRLASFQMAETERQHSINLAGTKTIVDVATGGATAGATASSNATLDALLALIGGNAASRNGQVCPQPVALYTPAQPVCNGCPCNG